MVTLRALFLSIFLQEDKDVSYNLLVYRDKAIIPTKKRLPGHTQIPTGRMEGWKDGAESACLKDARSLACGPVPEL